jgi:hypothetical protein
LKSTVLVPRTAPSNPKPVNDPLLANEAKIKKKPTQKAFKTAPLDKIGLIEGLGYFVFTLRAKKCPNSRGMKFLGTGPLKSVPEGTV